MYGFCICSDIIVCKPGADSLEDPTLANPFSGSEEEEAPPIPERPDEEHIPKVYTLGYDGIFCCSYSI